MLKLTDKILTIIILISLFQNCSQEQLMKIQNKNKWFYSYPGKILVNNRQISLKYKCEDFNGLSKFTFFMVEEEFNTLVKASKLGENFRKLFNTISSNNYMMNNQLIERVDLSTSNTIKIKFNLEDVQPIIFEVDPDYAKEIMDTFVLVKASCLMLESKITTKEEVNLKQNNIDLNSNNFPVIFADNKKISEINKRFFEYKPERSPISEKNVFSLYSSTVKYVHVKQNEIEIFFNKDIHRSLVISAPITSAVNILYYITRFNNKDKRIKSGLMTYEYARNKNIQFLITVDILSDNLFFLEFSIKDKHYELRRHNLIETEKNDEADNELLSRIFKIRRKNDLNIRLSLAKLIENKSCKMVADSNPYWKNLILTLKDPLEITNEITVKISLHIETAQNIYNHVKIFRKFYKDFYNSLDNQIACIPATEISCSKYENPSSPSCLNKQLLEILITYIRTLRGESYLQSMEKMNNSNYFSQYLANICNNHGKKLNYIIDKTNANDIDNYKEITEASDLINQLEKNFITDL